VNRLILLRAADLKASAKGLEKSGRIKYREVGLPEVTGL